MTISNYDLLLFIIITGCISLGQFIELSLPIGYVLHVDGFIFSFLTLTLSAMFLLNPSKHVSGNFPINILVFFLFVIYAIISISWAASFSYALRDSFKMIFLLVFILVAREVLIDVDKSIKLIDKIFSIIRILIVIHFISILLLYSRDIVSSLNFLKGYEISNVKGYFALNTAFISVYIYYVLLIKRKSAKFVFPAVLGLIIILLTGSRTYILAFLAGLITTFFRFEKGYVFKTVILLLLTYVLFVFCLSVYKPLKESMFWNPDQVTFVSVLAHPTMLVDENIVNTSGRFNVWRYLYKSLHSYNNSIIGGGIGGAKFVLKDGAISESTRFAHGEYAKYFAELGWIGLSFIILFYLSSFFVIVQKLKEAKDELSIKLYKLILSFLILLIVSGIGYEVLYQLYLVSLFFLLFFAAENRQMLHKGTLLNQTGLTRWLI